jgi:hypothetical protein
MKPLHEQVAAIETRADLVAFIEALRDDLVTDPLRWENPTLESFLSALASWTEVSVRRIASPGIPRVRLEFSRESRA